MTEEITVTLKRDELQAMLKQAAHDGAKQALIEVGLGDADAVVDVKDFRALMRTWRHTRRLALEAAVKRIVDFVMIILVLGITAKLGLTFLGVK